MFKALFVPQGYLTLAAVVLIGYRSWTGDWWKFSAPGGRESSQQTLSWDRQTNTALDERQLRALKREILDQLDRMSSEQAKPEL